MRTTNKARAHLIGGSLHDDLIANVLFYREGIPELITKEDVRHRYNELVHAKAQEDALMLESTSGSTGIPLNFLESTIDRRIYHECHCRLYLLLKHKRNKVVTLSDFPSDGEGAPMCTLSYEHEGEELVANEYRMLSSSEPCEVLERRLCAEAPDMVEGYPSAIYLVARSLLSQRRTLDSVRAICPSGEYLDVETRAALAQAFPNATILCRYGANELGSLAWQCPLCGEYHFNADFYGVRVDDDDRFLISKRYTSAFQLIHYDIGDELRLSGFGECEVNLPTVEILGGRRDDLLVDPQGRSLPVMPFHFGDMPELMQWQIIQNADLSLDIQAIAASETPALAAELERRVRADLGGVDLPMRVCFVRRFATGAKLKRVVSRVGADRSV